MRRSSMRRRLRSLGGRLIRRLGLLPGGQPDGLGQDEALAETVLTERVLVFFGDAPDSLYQIEGWYEPLRALDDAHGVAVICMDSRTAAAVRESSGLTVLTIAQDATLEGLLERSGVQLCLYVNHSTLNFIPLRFRSLAHVSLLHGDSDKVVTVSNQVKAYDRTFVSGRASLERFAQHVPFFDAEERCVVVGRPQSDALGASAHEPRPQPRAGRAGTVLYAPTWEGAGVSVAYGSLATIGETLVSSLIEAGFDLIYRPHPLSGVRDGDYGDADGRVREILARATAAQPAARHRVSVGGSLADDFAASDVLVCDVSAVASDWLPTGRPLVVTVPEGDLVRVATTALLRTVPRLSSADAATAGALVRDQLTLDPTRQARAALVEHYFGDTTPGAAMSRFLQACEELMQAHAREWARIQSNTERPDSQV